MDNNTNHERLERLAKLLEQTKAAHHEAFVAHDGADPEWPRWYAETILQDLPILNIQPPSLEILADTLRQLDRDYQEQGVETAWPVFYAREMIKRFGR